MSEQKNHYEMGTPEWQLFENMRSHQLVAASAAADAERALEKGRRAREKMELYQAALNKLSANA